MFFVVCSATLIAPNDSVLLQEKGESRVSLEDELIEAFDRDRDALFAAMFEPDSWEEKKRCEEIVDKLKEAREVLSRSCHGIL